VPNLAREAATQVARSVAEDLGRRAAHAAVRAAQEAAKQVATEIARGTAERTARTTAQESARAVAEQAAREVSEGVSQRNIARGLEVNRDELLKEIEAQVRRHSQETLVIATGSPEFKQQVVQMVRSGIQPIIETIARETSERSIQQATANFSAQGGGPAESRATLALVIGIVAILASAAAIVGSILKLF
jgi:transposase-like protein